VAFASLAGGLIPLLMQLRKLVAESERLLIGMNIELPWYGIVAGHCYSL
jgi:hypothetical protein